jgi:hypothetical protein
MSKQAGALFHDGVYCATCIEKPDFLGGEKRAAFGTWQSIKEREDGREKHHPVVCGSYRIMELLPGEKIELFN